MSLQPGQTIDGKYRIVRLIGEGGMGTVHEGENLLIRRRVAIKVLNAQAAEAESALIRFEREAQAAGRIGSDHILEIIDLGVLPTGERYMVMEYLDGETLAERISRAGRLAAPTVYPLIRQALIGLQAAHLAGIVHRDLKPDNLFILREKAGQADFLKLIDFGISKFVSQGRQLSMTRTGAVVGTPYYMSPEQARGSKDLDARSDLYAVGVILYESLTGQVPFTGNTFNELLFKIVTEEPRPLTDLAPDVDPVFAGIVERAMAREPAQRFDSAEAMAQQLDQWAVGAGVEMPRTSEFPLLLPAAAPRASLSTPAPRSTGSSWAMSQHDAGATRRAVPLALGAVALGVLLLGGGVYAAYRLLGGAHEVLIQAATPPPSGVSVASAPEVPKPMLQVEQVEQSVREKGSASNAKSAPPDERPGAEPEVKPVEASDSDPSADTVRPESQLTPARVRQNQVRRSKSTPQKSIDFGY